MNFLEQLNEQLQPGVPLGAREEEHVAEEIVAICVEDRIRLAADLKAEFVAAYGDYFTDPDFDDVRIFDDSRRNYEQFIAMPTR